MKRCIIILAAALAGCAQSSDNIGQPEPQSAVRILRELHRDELSTWDRLTLAIALTESKCNPDATGSAGDIGILQITPIYAREAARISGQEYNHDDARDIGKSLEMFDAVQGHYNPDHDRAEAIRRHNPGAGPGYAAEVLRNLELVERYEAVRAALLVRE